MCPITHESLLALLICVVASFAFGFVWYGPLFGKRWAELAGVKMDPKPPLKPMLLALLNTVLQVFALAYIVNNYTTHCFFDAAFVVWLGFQVPLLLSTVAWEGKSWNLFLLNGTFYFLNLQLVAAILKFAN